MATKKDEKEKRKEEALFLSKMPVSINMLEEWVTALSEENHKRKTKSDECQGLFITNRTVEFLFVMCQKLDLSSSVKFNSVALFDAFMLRHVRELLEMWKKMDLPRKEKKKQWKSIEDKIRSQVTLRAFSCVQIASKMEQQTNTVKVADFNRIMAELGHCYTSDHILRSELRVMKILNYNLRITSPLVYIETMLKIMQLRRPSLPIDKWYSWAIMVLEVVFLLRDDLYTNTVKQLVPKGTPILRAGIVEVQADYVFLAGSAITTAVFIADGQEKSRKIAKSLQTMFDLSTVDVMAFCGAIVGHVMKGVRKVH